MGLGWIWPVVLMLGLAALVWGLMHARASARVDEHRDDEHRDDEHRDDERRADERGVEPRAGGGGAGRAREILRERFARGEITEEELRDRLRVLDDR
jgi:putative membrane protein